jgi:hypothetical protein
MYERERSFHPPGENPMYLESARGRMKEAIQAIRSRAEKPQP